MMLWLAVAALAAAGLLYLLECNAKAYTSRAEAHWPALGQFIDAHGVRLHVMRAGPEDAPRILLIHGASANLREVWPLAESFTGTHRVLAFDRPGYGYSSRPPGSQSLAFQAKLAAAALEGGRAIVIAHSLGAAVALRLAIDQPDLVRGLVLIAPASHPYPGRNAWWAELSATPIFGDAFCQWIIPLVAPAASRGGIANNFKPNATPKNYYEDAGVGLAFRPNAFKASALDVCATNREFAAQAPDYAEILAPTIVITSDVDNVVSPRLHARALALEMPAAELVSAPDTGHMPHRLRPDLVITALHRLEAMEAASVEG